MTPPKNSKKPKKPKGSPLTPSNNGQWIKKINGKVICFGPWDDYEEAIASYGRLIAGQSQGRDPNGSLTIRELCNNWLRWQKDKVEANDLSKDTFDDYLQIAKRVIDVLGPSCVVDSLCPADFRRIKRKITAHHKSLHVQKKEIISTKSIFKFGVANRLIENPHFGTEFSPPSAKRIKLQRAENKRRNGERRFEAAEIRKILEVANSAIKAMTLLAINSGVGNEDLRHIEPIDIDFEAGWLNYSRRKTGSERRAKLWPETIEAIRSYQALTAC